MKSIALKQWEACAYAAGRLTQLRRVVKPQPVSSFGPLPSDAVAEEERPGLWSISSYGKGVRQYMGLTPFSHADGIEYFRRFCPYGAPGDALALREAWCFMGSEDDDIVDYKYYYRADESMDSPFYKNPCSCGWCDGDEPHATWQPSSRMPLSAVRWHPVITAVRLERVQDMSETDAFRCGIERIEIGPFEIHSVPVHPMTDTYANSYRKQFDRDNPRTPWESNPWTWVIEMEEVKG